MLAHIISAHQSERINWLLTSIIQINAMLLRTSQQRNTLFLISLPLTHRQLPCFLLHSYQLTGNVIEAHQNKVII